MTVFTLFLISHTHTIYIYIDIDIYIEIYIDYIFDRSTRLFFVNCGDMDHLYKPYFPSPYTNPTPKPTPYRKLCAFYFLKKTNSV